MSVTETRIEASLSLVEPPLGAAWEDDAPSGEGEGSLQGAEFPTSWVPGIEPQQPLAVGFTAALRIETDRGKLGLVLPLEVELRSSPSGKRTLRLEGVSYRLHLRIEVDSTSTTLKWRLETGGGDATARARNLQVLRALSGTGSMLVEDARTGARVGRVDLVARSWFDSELERDLEFLAAVADVERWSGMHIVLPERASAEEVARLSQAAAMVRARQVSLRIDGEITARTATRIDEADELRLSQDMGIYLFGQEIPLGVATGSVRVRLVSSTSDAADSSQFVTVFAPMGDAATQLIWTLDPLTGAEGDAYGVDEVPDRTQEWFWSDAWQAGEAEAQAELATGRTVRHPTTEAFFAYLDEHGTAQDA